MTYHETTWNMRRVFELHEDCVEVSLKSQHLDAHDKIRYADLQPGIVRFWLRPLVPFRMGLVFLVVGVIGLVVSFLKPELEFLRVLPFVAPALAFIVLFGYARKVEYAQWKTSAGVVLLNVARSGPDKRQFDAFVAEIQHRIDSAKRG